MFELVQGCRDRGTAAYAELQEAEFATKNHGYSVAKRHHEVCTGYFEDIAQVITVGLSCTTRLRASKEHEQFH